MGRSARAGCGVSQGCEWLALGRGRTFRRGRGAPATFPGALPDARVEPRASRVPHAAESGSSDWASRVRLCSLGLLSQKSTTDGFRNTHSFVMPREAGRPRRRRFPTRGLRVHFPARGRCPHAGSGARALSGGLPQKPALAPSTTAPPRGRVSSRGPRLPAP